jgi:hypothetical protein
MTSFLTLGRETNAFGLRATSSLRPFTSVKKLVIDKKTLGKSHLGNSSAVSDGGVATPGRARSRV